MARSRYKKLNALGMSPPWRHITLFYTMLRSPAYRSLDPKARALIVEFAMRNNGINNGRISMSVREAADGLGVVPNTAASALDSLIDRGFIVPTVKGSFSWKQALATTWRLTWLPTGSKKSLVKPTNDYLRWKPPQKKITVANIDTETTHDGRKI